MKSMILASCSTLYGSSFLEYLQPELEHFFSDISELLFIPYARPGGISYAAYTEIVQKAFEFMNLSVKGIQDFSDPKVAIENAEGIFVGGGNTFVLVDTLHSNCLFDVLGSRIDIGIPYLGTSAGTNIAGVNMKTTNDMPIVQPKSYTTIGAIPFNINAHYIDPIIGSTHKGETRETRIKEFHSYNTVSVLGLREGSWLFVEDDKIYLKGKLNATLFVKNTLKKEYPPMTLFSELEI